MRRKNGFGMAIVVVLAVLFFLPLFTVHDSRLTVKGSRITAFAADVTPTETQRWSTYARSWTLATTQTTTGDSNTATQVQYCSGPKTLEIKVSGGSVNISCAVKEGANGVTTKTITLAAAGTTRYSTDHHIESLYVTSTITAGTVDSIILRCN